MSRFDIWLVLNGLDEEITNLKLINTARSLIPLSLRCDVNLVITVEMPQNVRFTGTRWHISSCLDKIGRECGSQPEFLKRKITQSEINKYKYNDLRHIWEPYLKSNIICLAVIYAKHAL